MRRLDEREGARARRLADAREASETELLWEVLSTFLRDDLALDDARRREVELRFARALAGRGAAR